MEKKIKAWGLISRVENAGFAEEKQNNTFWTSSIASAEKVTLRREGADGKLLIELAIWFLACTEQKRARRGP